MKICLVTSFPPSKERLNEYGYHLARELQERRGLSVTVLADQYAREEVLELPGFEVLRCWRFNDLLTPFKLIRALKKIKPDVVWFNLVFSSFGDRPIPAFIGLLTPVLVRLCGWYSHVTLHHLMESLDLTKATKFARFYQFAGYLATKLLLGSNSVSVLLPSYRSTLLQKYKAQNIHLRRHGVFSSNPIPPDYTKRGNPEHRILAFGKWGTYKRLELLIEAFTQVAEKIPNAKLVIAGSNHPMTPGYVEAVRDRYKDSSRFEFHGYIPEEEVPGLFSLASVLVMPYTSAGGPSGVAHQACEFALPIVSSDIPDFRDMADDSGIAMEFFENGNADSLAETLIRFLQDPEKQLSMAEQNYGVAMQMSMREIIRQYLLSFTRWKHAKSLNRKRPAIFAKNQIEEYGKFGIREMVLDACTTREK